MREDMKEAPLEIVLFERGIGQGYSGVIVSFHESYSSYVKLRKRTNDYPFVDSSQVDGFMISLEDKIHYRPLTLATLAQHILTLQNGN